MGGPKPAPKSGLQWHRALTALRSAGVSLHPGVPPPSKAKTRRVLGIVEQSLHAEQCRSLTSALPLQPRAGSQGRGSAHLFNQAICPMQGKYNEWRKLGSIPNPTHRKSIRKLRLGQVLCATERVKWGEDLGPSPLTCSYGAPVEDSHHVIMECPHTAPARCACVLSRPIPLPFHLKGGGRAGDVATVSCQCPPCSMTRPAGRGCNAHALVGPR